MEKVLKIEKMESHKVTEDHWDTFDGCLITTDKQVIEVGISNDQQCCENWGYMWLNENPEEFVGAKLKDVELVDTALNIEKWNKEFEYGLDEGSVMFINFKTDRGVLQFAVYNSHNGYYGHSAYIKSIQVSKETTL